jgi:hypothetical protein
MASEISGLEPLEGYLKHGNYVVRLKVPYLELKNRHEKFIERKVDPGNDDNVSMALPAVIPPSGVQGVEVTPPSNGPQLFFE